MNYDLRIAVAEEEVLRSRWIIRDLRAWSFFFGFAAVGFLALTFTHHRLFGLFVAATAYGAVKAREMALAERPVLKMMEDELFLWTAAKELTQTPSI